MPISPVLVFVVIVMLYLISSVKILAEYERGVIFRLGKLLPLPKGPGVILVFAPIDRIVRVSLRTVEHHRVRTRIGLSRGHVCLQLGQHPHAKFR